QPLSALPEQRAGALRAGAQCRQRGAAQARGRYAAAFRPRDPSVGRLTAYLRQRGTQRRLDGMDHRIALPEWHTLARLDDASLPLLDTALLIAHDEYPDLDPGLYDAQVRAHAAGMRAEIDAIEHPAVKMQAINRHLFGELGYAGDHDQYYDPRNSYINEVFERRRGNPISLAMVQIEVARRLGVPLDGVSFPGHFLVRLPVDDGVLVMDPFNRGRPLDVDELRQRARPHLGRAAPDDEARS